MNIDGVRTFGSSFLEEVIGGTIRSSEFTASDLKKLLKVRYTKPHLKFYADFIRQYLEIY